MEKEDLMELDKFDLVWCTGVLYHNAEQLRLLKRLYNLLSVTSILVLETAPTRNPILQNQCCVEIFWPETYKDTGTITHLPSKAAVNSWLEMVGFDAIKESDCYNKFNEDLKGQRVAYICQKNIDGGPAYYHKSGKNPEYPLGDAS